jgi:hypothetical protein
MTRATCVERMGVAAVGLAPPARVAHAARAGRCAAARAPVEPPPPRAAAATPLWPCEPRMRRRGSGFAVTVWLARRAGREPEAAGAAGGRRAAQSGQEGQGEGKTGGAEDSIAKPAVCRPALPRRAGGGRPARVTQIEHQKAGRQGKAFRAALWRRTCAAAWRGAARPGGPHSARPRPAAALTCAARSFRRARRCSPCRRPSGPSASCWA